MEQPDFTYAGLFDDRVHLYPHHGSLIVSGDLQLDQSVARNREDLVNRRCFEAAVMGHPITINDGYLLQQPGLRLSVMRRDSPLRVLTRHGFVRVLSRNGDLTQLNDWAKDAGVNSMGDFDSSELSEFQREIETCGAIQPWKNLDTSEAQLRLFRDVFNKHRENPAGFQWPSWVHQFFQEAGDSFLPIVENDPSAFRTKWEEHVTELGKQTGRQDTPRYLMHFANAVYHASYVYCLNDDSETVATDTLFQPAFLEYFQSPDPNDHEVREDEFVLELPKSVFTDRDSDGRERLFFDGRPLAKIVDPEAQPFDTRTPGGELFERKNMFLAILADYFEGIKSAGDVRQALSEYRESLCSHFEVSGAFDMKMALKLNWKAAKVLVDPNPAKALITLCAYVGYPIVKHVAAFTPVRFDSIPRANEWADRHHVLGTSMVPTSATMTELMRDLPQFA